MPGIEGLDIQQLAASFISRSSLLCNIQFVKLGPIPERFCFEPAVGAEALFPMIGKTLGHYQITNELGKGGMGEVYQAKDQVLGRDVAIKVLPDEFARDVDRIARFHREAKVLASLNHVNIAAIYGLEESGATNFLVLELVEGETLADRIKAGPISLDESLRLALQITEALEAAHEKGVIHRDLKPSNIKVTPDGKVKVLDFGLAKAFSGEREEVNLSHSPTLSDAATMQGVILGTAAYMSPEQAKGKNADKRADIWAFGVVLFEILTGRGAFQGDDVSEIIASVIKGDVQLDRLPANLHPRVREATTRCLQKDLKRRYSSITEARYEIEQALADPDGLFLQPVTTAESRKKLRTILPWVAAALILGAIIAGVAVWKLNPSKSQPISRFYYELPKDQQFSSPGNINLAISPDGRQFVYIAGKRFYLRSLDKLDARLIPGTDDDPRAPFFSPDSQWLGYWSAANGQLKKISIRGGAPVTLCDASFIWRASWGVDNMIVYPQEGRGVMRVSAAGGIPELIIDEPKETIVFPQILPDGKTVLFTLITKPPYQVVVQSLKSEKRTMLFAGGPAQYFPTGHLVYVAGNNSLFAIQYDLDRLEVIGGPVPVVEGVWRLPGGATQYAISDSGTLIYMPGTTVAAASPKQNLVWVDRNGKEEPLAVPPNPYDSPRISPDGTKVALQFGRANIGIWDLVRKTMTQLTFDADFYDLPLWTPDGKRIAFLSQRERESKVYWKASNGTGTEDPLGSAPNTRMFFPSTWSGDGKNLVLTMLNQAALDTQTFDIGILSMEGDHKWRLLLQAKHNEAQPQISPDGRWMSYTSNESGQYEVYVRSFPEVEKEKWQVSTSGGDSPLWSRDGRELLYRCGDAVMAVSVKTETAFSLETPKILFRGTYVSSNLSSNYDLVTWDISPEGKRFLMMKLIQSTEKAPEAEVPRRINIVLNWTEELKQRVPTK
jgi:serine/threonine protein kinase